MHLALIWLAVGLAKLLVEGRHLGATLMATLIVLPTVLLACSLGYLDIVSATRVVRRRLVVHAGQALMLSTLALSLWLAEWPVTRAAGLAVAAVVGGGAVLVAAGRSRLPESVT